MASIANISLALFTSSARLAIFFSRFCEFQPTYILSLQLNTTQVYVSDMFMLHCKQAIRISQTIWHLKRLYANASSEMLTF